VADMEPEQQIQSFFYMFKQEWDLYWWSLQR